MTEPQDELVNDNDQAIDLDNTSRQTGGINIGANTVTQATAHLPVRERELIRWSHTYARDNDWRWEDVVRALGYSNSTWWRIWNGSYVYPKEHAKAGQHLPLKGQCDAIAKFQKQVGAMLAAESEDFVETSVWKRVDWVCRRSFSRHAIGLVYGESQIGKTRCLQQYALTNNHGMTRYVEIPPAGGVQLMTRKIASALNVASKTSFDRLIEDVIDALDKSKLLIVDEVHRIFTTYQKTSVMRCLDVLRYIQGQTKCGMVLSGTNVFRDQLREGDFFQYLKQLRRRGINEVQLPSIAPREDLDALARKHGLNPKDHGKFEVEARGKRKLVTYDSIEEMNAIARNDGLGKYIQCLQDAVDMATNRREQVGWYHFVRAHHIITAMAGEGGVA